MNTITPVVYKLDGESYFQYQINVDDTIRYVTIKNISWMEGPSVKSNEMVCLKLGCTNKFITFAPITGNWMYNLKLPLFGPPPKGKCEFFFRNEDDCKSIKLTGTIGMTLEFSTE